MSDSKPSTSKMSDLSQAQRRMIANAKRQRNKENIIKANPILNNLLDRSSPKLRVSKYVKKSKKGPMGLSSSNFIGPLQRGDTKNDPRYVWFRCPSCPQLFTHEGYMQKHIQELHESQSTSSSDE